MMMDSKISEGDGVEKPKTWLRKRRTGADRDMMKAYMSLPEMTRRRKDVPSFRKVGLSESDFKRIVGKRIKVYWDGSRKWFTGHIKSFDSKKKLHRILYNDGDVEELNLLIERIELEVVPSEGFTLCSNLGTNSINRDLGSVGEKTNVGDSLADGVNKPVGKEVANLSGKPYMSSLEITRRRKEVPSFRKVELSESDFDRIVGKRIKVYWEGSRKWFTGRIESFDNEKKLHRILYNDGDVEELNLLIERIELEVVPIEGFTLHSSLRNNSIKRELGSVAEKTNVGDSLEDSVDKPVEKLLGKVSEKSISNGHAGHVSEEGKENQPRDMEATRVFEKNKSPVTLGAYISMSRRGTHNG